MTSQYYKIFKTLKLSYLQQNGLKSLCRYSSHEVILCGGRIYSLYVDVAVVLARNVCETSEFKTVLPTAAFEVLV